MAKSSPFVEAIHDQLTIRMIQRKNLHREHGTKIWSWTSFMAALNKPKPGKRRVVR